MALDKASGFTGCYASHIVLHSGTAIFPIPDHVSDKVAAPINCALATMVNALSNLPPGGPDRVAMIQVRTIILYLMIHAKGLVLTSFVAPI